MGNENKENTMKPDNAGEFILKGTALTLSSKGVTDDLKEVLKIKIDYVKCTLADVIKLTETILNSKNTQESKRYTQQGAILPQLLGSIASEVIFTNIALNSLIGSLVEREQSLSEEQKALFLTETDNIVYKESTKIR